MRLIDNRTENEADVGDILILSDGEIVMIVEAVKGFSFANLTTPFIDETEIFSSVKEVIEYFRPDDESIFIEEIVPYDQIFLLLKGEKANDHRK